MPVVVACFKWVVDEAYIRRGAGGALDFSSVDYKIGEYDRNAIEEAVRLRDAGGGGSVIGLTVGPPESAKGVKDALSRGMDQAIFVSDPAFRDLEPSQTAAILAEVIGTRIPQYDLITCGEGSSDLYAQQVGPRLAELLGIPCVCFVQKLALEGDRLKAERRVEDGVEVVEAPLPALVTVLPDINTPRIPGVKDTLMAGKKPVTTVRKEELAGGFEATLKAGAMTAASLERAGEKLAADAAGIARFVDALRKSGLIR
ncbi:MAG: electron transfer flavoprotein subunit beta/FixA family protein [Syntrophobacterales bacterium]|nr:electron transfer flavoprotein subunit beta/FixA family protein [Syntrophobacterales bacterium]